MGIGPLPFKGHLVLQVRKYTGLNIWRHLGVPLAHGSTPIHDSSASEAEYLCMELSFRFRVSSSAFGLYC